MPEYIEMRKGSDYRYPAVGSNAYEGRLADGYRLTGITGMNREKLKENRGSMGGAETQGEYPDVTDYRDGRAGGDTRRMTSGAITTFKPTDVDVQFALDILSGEGFSVRFDQVYDYFVSQGHLPTPENMIRDFAQGVASKLMGGYSQDRVEYPLGPNVWTARVGTKFDKLDTKGRPRLKRTFTFWTKPHRHFTTNEKRAYWWGHYSAYLEWKPKTHESWNRGFDAGARAQQKQEKDTESGVTPLAQPRRRR